MRVIACIFSLTILLSSGLRGQTTYYSNASGSLNTLANWTTARDGSGVSPATFAGNDFVVQNGDSMTAVSGFSSNSLTIESGGTLFTLDNTISGSSFTLATGGSLHIGSTEGIASYGATGAVQSTTRTFSTGGNYVYDGTSGAQNSGNGLPSTVHDLTVSNPSGVTLNVATSVSGTLALVSGSFTIGGNRLTLANAVAGTPSNLSTGSSSWIKISGTASGITLPSSVTTLNMLELDDTNGLTLDGPLAVSNVVLTNGQLNLNGNTLTINNGFVTRYPGGSFSDSPFYTGGVYIRYYGASSMTTGIELPVSSSGLSVTLENNNSASVALADPTKVYSLNLSSGELDLNGHVLTLAANGVIKRGAGTLSASPVFEGEARLEYYNAVTTGVEVPSADTVLSNVLVNVSGTVTLGSNARVNGAVSIYNGTLEGGSFTLSYGSSATLLYYNLPSLRVTNGTEWPEADGPFNVQINSTNGVTLHEPRTVAGQISLQAGNFALGSNTLTVDGTLYVSGGTVTGDSVVYGSNGTLAYGWNTSQRTTNDLEFPTAYGPNNLTVSTPGGVRLHSSRRINGTLDLGGLLDLQSNILTLGLSASVTGHLDATGMLYASSASGEVRKLFSAPGFFEFPIGDSTGTPEYSPFAVNFSSGSFDEMAYVGVKVVNAKHPDNISSSDFLSRYWIVTSSGISSFQCDIDFFYVDADITGSEPGLSGGMYNGSVWTLLDPVSTGNNQGTGTVIGFGDFSAGQQSFLPVALRVLSVTARDGAAELRWSTETEINNYGFDIERRQCDDHPERVQEPGWWTVGFVQGGGTSAAPRDYSFTDRNLAAGRYAYRIRQIDNNGQAIYSAAAEVEVGLKPGRFELFDNYPNPFNPSTIIRYGLPERSKVRLQIYDMLGRAIETLVDQEQEARFFEYTWRAHVPSGIYFCRLTANSTEDPGRRFVQTKKMVLVR